MESIDLKLNTDTSQADKSIDALNKSIIELNKNLSQSGKEAEDGMVAIDEGAKKAKKSSFTLGKVLKGAFAIFGGAGIVALAVKVFKAFGEVLKENQNVVNLFSTATEAVSIVFTDFVNFLLSNTATVTNFMNALFKDPQKTLTEFAQQIQQGVIDRFNQLLEVFGLVGKALGHLVKGEFGEAFESIKTAGKEVVDVYTGVDGSFDKVAESVTNYTKQVLKTAKANVDLANSAELATAKNQGLLEQFDFENEKLRQIRDEERNSIADRIKANNDLRDNLAKQQKLMLANAQISIDAANAQLAKDKDNIQFKKQLIEAENELAAVKATIAGFESEFKANDLALDKEKIELTNSKLESEANLSIEKKRMNAEQIDDDLARLLKMQEIDAAEQVLQENRLQRILDEAGEGTQAKVDAQIALDEFMSESDQTNLDRQTEIVEAQTALEEKKRADKEKTFNDLLTIAGAESKLGKAILVAKQALALKEMIMEMKSTLFSAKQTVTKASLKGAEATADSASGLAKTSSALPFPANIPLIIGYVAQAVGIIGAVKSAVSSAKSAASSVGGGIPSVGGEITAPTAAAGSAPPDMSSVGGSGFNQLADAIGQQNQQPIQTFVVASDVTTAQSLDRNIIDGATL
tara:strand:+ start:1673 stop:3574 length:1902 start_codon:yes stop_codon:yes gene_type:complete